MRTALFLKFFLAGALCTLPAGLALAADGRAPEAFPSNPDDYVSWLTTYPRSGVAPAAAVPRNAHDMAALIELLEQTRATQLEAAQKANHLTLLVAVIFGTIGLMAMVLTAFFQWRAVNRLVGLYPVHTLPVLAQGGGPMAVSQAVEQSNARLLHLVERLQQRLLELEQAARAPLSETGSSSAAQSDELSAGNPAKTPANGNSHIATLLAQGQLLLDDQPEKALACFDEILAIEPRHSEALVKKGSALEKLHRLDEAVECYDRAIEADNAMTIAYLHKGGLFNRMDRYNEALACYEQALRTQEKGAA
jgi:tetratricopeptide (TPR) repeat protein